MDILKELIGASPIAAALIALAVLFFRYMKSRDKEWTDTVKHMSEQQIKAHDSCVTTVKENTLMMGEVKQLIQTRIRQVGEEHG